MFTGPYVGKLVSFLIGNRIFSMDGLVLRIFLKWDISKFNQTTMEDRVWMSNYTPLFRVDVITYPCLHCDAGSDNLYQQKGLRMHWTITLHFKS